MKRAGTFFTFLTVCAVVLVLAVPVSADFLQNSTGLVSMEAEHYQVNVPLGSYAWTPVANPGYSGTGALQALPDDTPSSLVAGAGPRMDYQVQFTKTGTHYIWIRALAHSGGSDSLYVGLDGGTAGAVYMTGLNWDGVTWKWSKQKSGGIATINVTSTGLHTINVWMRESGVVLDKLVLTTSSSYTPTGTGPAETVGSTTGIPPTVATNAATSVTETGGTVNGGVNPNGLATTAWFEWGTDPSLATFSVTTNQSLGSGTSIQAVNAALSGLSSGTPYYFRVAASSSGGTTKGSISSFSTITGSVSADFLQDGTGLVSMEAEHYQVNVPLGGYAWTPVTNPGSSGTGALQALPDDTPSSLVAGAGPRMDYQVQFTKTGTHYIWIRALAHSGGSDSLYVGLDGGTAGAVYMTGLNWDGVTWKWSKQKSGGIATINVTSTGLHTINVWMRESGVVLDKLVLTTSSSYTPTGTGPAETVGSTVGIPSDGGDERGHVRHGDRRHGERRGEPERVGDDRLVRVGYRPEPGHFQRHYQPVPGVRDVDPGGERGAVGVKFGDALLLPGGGFQLRGDHEGLDFQLQHDYGVRPGRFPAGWYRPGFHGSRALPSQCSPGRLRMDAGHEPRLLRHRCSPGLAR